MEQVDTSQAAPSRITLPSSSDAAKSITKILEHPINSVTDATTVVTELHQFIARPIPAGQSSEVVLVEKAAAIWKAVDIIVQYLGPEEFVGFVRGLAVAWVLFPRARAAKFINDLLDRFAKASYSRPVDPVAYATLYIDLVRDLVAWSAQEKRAYLLLSLQTRLASLLTVNRRFSEALTLTGELLFELKKADDKVSQVQVFLIESKIYVGVRNFAKSKAALVAARTASSALVCPTYLQAALDMQSGLVHCEDDFGLAYSYFIEAVDAYSALAATIGTPSAEAASAAFITEGDAKSNALKALKYMLLCKIMLGDIKDLQSTVLGGKLAERVLPNANAVKQNRDIQAILAVAQAYKERSLERFQSVLSEFAQELTRDEVVQGHLAALFDSLLQANILELIRPYSRIDIAYVAGELHLEMGVAEGKLAQMILDGVVHGIIDHDGVPGGAFVLLPKPISEPAFEYAGAALRHLESALESLREKAKLIA